MWQPIETAPKDQFLLLCGPSGYTTTPMVVTTGRMCSDYHAGRWIDHANDDLTDWGFRPTHWAPLVLPGAQPAPSLPDGWKEAAISWEVCASIHREYARGKDPFFSTRQGDFVKHAQDARNMFASAHKEE